MSKMADNGRGQKELPKFEILQTLFAIQIIDFVLSFFARRKKDH